MKVGYSYKGNRQKVKQIKMMKNLNILTITSVISLLSFATFLSSPIAHAQTTTTKYLNGRIVFIMFDEFSNNPEINIMNSDGSEKTQITNDNFGKYKASLSRDGSKIAYPVFTNSDMEIHSIGVDGGNETPLTNNTAGEDDPAWSPDGSKIAFVTNRDGNDEIYTMNADGSNPTRLTNNATFDSGPTWSPDGSKISFVNYTGSDGEIYTMNADGSNQASLTTNNAEDYHPSWSPDGTKITFISVRDNNEEIYTMDADGSNQTRITNTITEEESPSYSPDGTKLLATIYPDDNYESSQVYVMDIDGSNRIPLTDGPTYVTAFNTQPWQYLPYTQTQNDNGTITSTIPSSASYSSTDYTVVANETLILDGTLCDVTIQSGGTLQGTGSIAPDCTLTVETGGVLAPGHSPGCLASGNLILSGTFQTELASTTACTGYDQLQVTGTVTLTNATLTPSLLNGFVPKAGDSFTLIQNDAADPVTGTFTNLPEGSTLTIANSVFKISYVGGDGNDVTLTAQAIPNVPNTGFQTQSYMMAVFIIGGRK